MLHLTVYFSVLIIMVWRKLDGLIGCTSTLVESSHIVLLALCVFGNRT